MQLVPTDADVARQTRFRDRFYDLYVQEPMQKIVTDRLRPAGKNDPHGVERAKGLLQAAYGMIEHDMSTKTCERRAQVDDYVRKAVAAGGSTYNEPQDHGFMYAHGFQDLDGHIWELIYMDPSAIKQG